MTSNSHRINPATGISLPEFQTSIDQQLAAVVARSDDLPDLFEPIPVSFTARGEALDILRWLRDKDTVPRAYWRDRSGQCEIAGVGAAYTISCGQTGDFAACFRSIEKVLHLGKSNPFLRFLGGTRFDRHTSTEERWQAFPALWFVLPRLMVSRMGNEYFLTIATVWDGTAEIDHLRTDLLESFELYFSSGQGSERALPQMVSRTDTPNLVDWRHGTQKALRAIASREVDKIVLARRSDFEFSDLLDPYAYLNCLLSNGASGYGFLFQPNRSVAFVGVTPERLFLKKDRHLFTEALAGTVIAGESTEETAQHARELRDDPKNRREQRFVVDDLYAKLGGLCEDVTCEPEPGVVRLANVQHLVTNLSGIMKRAARLGDVYSTIHPTAAVCGTPMKQALKLSHEIEGFDRGWYASGVGSIAHQSTELAVAIRSGLINGRKLSLFAGAGIVQGSDPEAEWQELENKIAGSLRPLTGAHA